MGAKKRFVIYSQFDNIQAKRDFGSWIANLSEAVLQLIYKFGATSARGGSS